MIRLQYEKFGVDQYYLQHGNSYANPHIDRIHLCIDWVLQQTPVGSYLDLGCGNGEVTKYLLQNGYTDGLGLDPYMDQYYRKETGRDCLKLSFEQIQHDSFPRRFNTIVTSYALHLCEKSYFPVLLYHLSQACDQLVVISPSKYPVIDQFFTEQKKCVLNRTHCRIFKPYYSLC